MAKKILKSGLELSGIAPNILLKHIENTAPFIFTNEIETSGDKRKFLEKIRFYKKNLNSLKSINLADYFYFCLCAHWATAGTFVPTDVDNQIRMSLWHHKDILKFIDLMGKFTIDSWSWDYTQVTNRKSFNNNNEQVLSTHEGTWLSVAIGAYLALKKHKREALAKDVADLILLEVKKEEDLLLKLRQDRDHLNFLRAAPLMAHNFGDLDRVIDQWQMNPEDSFYKQIYKLGHVLSPERKRDNILVYAGQVNKELTSKENHRHMSMRQPKCLRKSHDFLIPIGPFMDDWGLALGRSLKLSLEEKAEICTALFEGFKRQDQALGYVRAFKNLTESLPNKLDSLSNFMPFDLLSELRASKFSELALESRSDFEARYVELLNEFVCPLTNQSF